jgi:lysyl-tRNA synthetase class 1
MVGKLKEYIVKNKELDLEKLTYILYDIPKRENITDEKVLKERQRLFFKDLYNLLISKDRGPRLATFLCALDREMILRLLEV